MTEVRREPLKLEEFEEVLKAYNSEFYSEFKRQAADQLLASYRTLAARVQELERERDGLKSLISDEMVENVKLFKLLGVEEEIKHGTAGTEAVVRSVTNLLQQLAEAQGRIVRKDEALEINRQAHGIVRDQLTQAEQQVARLREACEPLVAIYAEESTATDSPYFDGPILNKAQVRAIQHALRETGA